MHTSMLTTTSNAKPCYMEVPLTSTSPKDWHNNIRTASLHAFVKKDADSRQVYEHTVK